jgi:GlpG protein
MREIGTIDDEAKVGRLVDHLRALDIEAEARRGRQGWGVWVHHEDRVPQARAELDAFLADPEAPRFRDSGRVAREKRRERERKDAQHRRNTVELRDRLNVISPERCPVVHGMILLSVLLTAADWFTDHRALDRLAFAPTGYVVEPVLVRSRDGRIVEVEAPVPRSEGLGAIRRGELWRLWTPVFVHASGAHLVFNMISLYWIGGMLELRKGWKVVLALAVAASPVTLLGEYLWQVEWLGVKLPGYTVGMSGVIFALFGYAWMKSDYEPESDVRVSTNAILWMLAWLGICMTGAVGNIANAAHVTGLFFGMLVGLAPHLRAGLRWR